MKRRKVHKNTQANILQDSSLRRCALCVDYKSDFNIKKGQIAHIDHNKNNNKPSNLVFLCLEHHDEYDSSTSQSKGWTQEELKRSKNNLDAVIKKHREDIFPEIISSKFSKSTAIDKLIIKEKRHIISPEIYNLRIPIYHAYRDFVRKVVGRAKIEMDDLFEFANKTHEALFLYDENIVDFLKIVFEKGSRFRYLNKVTESPRLVDKQNWNALVEEESGLIQWFSDNFEQGRKLFKQYLHFG